MAAFLAHVWGTVSGAVVSASARWTPAVPVPFLGLPGSGKSTVVRLLSSVEPPHTAVSIPTPAAQQQPSASGGRVPVGPHAPSGCCEQGESVRYMGMDLIVLPDDAPDALPLHPAAALVWVLDASTPGSVSASAEALRSAVAALGSAFAEGRRPLLVFANKQDLPGAAGAEHVRRALRAVCAGCGGPVRVQPTIATLGDGVQDGLCWLANELQL
eukprot:m51a1_g1849 putative adp-ribosylation factor 1 (214) ;mRNA; r:591885-592526